MKKIASLLSVIILCLTVWVPASAVELSEQTTVGPLSGTECQRIVLTEHEQAQFEESKTAEEGANEISPLKLGYSSAGIAEIIGYPLLSDLDTGELFYYPNIGRKVTYGLINQSMSMRLTAAEAAEVYDEALQYLNSHIPTEGHSYAIVGWYVETLVQLRSDHPKYIEYRVAEPNFGQGTDYTKANIPYTITSYRIKGACAFPDNASDTEYYHIGGIEGTYYYATDTGKVLGIPFSAGLAMNVKE